MTSVYLVIKRHQELCNAARDLIAAKGHDYSRAVNGDEDTFRNIRVAFNLGVVNSPQDSALVRFLDKVMRVVSLRNPTTLAQVKGESFKDTILDGINYLVYILILYEEESEKLTHPENVAMAKFIDLLTTIKPEERQSFIESIISVCDNLGQSLIHKVAEDSESLQPTGGTAP